MIKTVLVPTSSLPTTDAAYTTGLALAQLLSAHLVFFYGRYDVFARAALSPHLDFCDDKEVSRAMLASQKADIELSKSARARFREFCDINDIAVSSTPSMTGCVTAEFIEGTSRCGLLCHARYSDVVVLARPSPAAPGSEGPIKQILLESGRPVIIAPDTPCYSLSGTVVVGWRETPEAARALAASMPLLKEASRVILLQVTEIDDCSDDGMNQMLSHLAWHGVKAEARVVKNSSKSIDQLVAVSRDSHAGLLVIGGYGHRPLSETIFGGVTRTFIEHAELPVFMVH